MNIGEVFEEMNGKSVEKVDVWINNGDMGIEWDYQKNDRDIQWPSPADNMENPSISRYQTSSIL